MQKVGYSNIRTTKMPVVTPDGHMLRRKLCNDILHVQDQGAPKFDVCDSSLKVLVFSMGRGRLSGLDLSL